MIADAKPWRAAVYRSSAIGGVTEGVVVVGVAVGALVGVVNLGASLLPYSTMAFSFEASTVVVTVQYIGGSVGWRKSTAMVNLLTVLASGLSNGSASI